MNIQIAGLDIFGDESITVKPKLKQRLIVAVIGTVAGALLWKKHRILGGLAGATVAGNAYGLSTGYSTRGEAVGNMMSNVAATAGALYLPIHPAGGYVAGLIGSKLITGAIRSEG